MPSIGEQGWGNLVSNNFEILDTNLNDLQNQITTNLNNLQDQIDVINTNIGNGTRVLSISSPPSITITTSNFGNYASYDNNVYIAQCYGNTTFSSIPQPSHSCRLMIISVNGNTTISGNINTYPTTLQTETPPNSTSTNTYRKEIIFNNFSSCTLTYIANANNSQILINHTDYLNFINNTSNLEYTLSIPHAIAAGGNDNNRNGTAGTATNTCNGGGGCAATYADPYKGGTGCIFGQYSGGNRSDGYGYGSGANNKYRCGLVIIVNGNLTITNSGTITQNGGNGNTNNGIGGYGGGAGRGSNDERYVGGGGGAPVFIYYTGTYVNNGTINTNGGGGSGESYNCGNGGAGGIKTTKITL